MNTTSKHMINPSDREAVAKQIPWAEVDELAAMTRQRDDLLAALKNLIGLYAENTGDGLPLDEQWAMIDSARAAIERAEKGAE